MKLLRRHFEKNFVDPVRFFDSGSQVIVYSAKTKPCHYVAASTLQDFSLEDRDLVTAFLKFLQKKKLVQTQDSQKLMSGLCQ